MKRSDYEFRLAALARGILFDWGMAVRTREIRREVRLEIREKFAAMMVERFGSVGYTGSPFDHRAAYGLWRRNWPIQAMHAWARPSPGQAFVVGIDPGSKHGDSTVYVVHSKPRT